MKTQEIIENTTTTDFLPLNGTDYVELYVGNAKQAAHYYKTAFGFQSLAYAGPETGVKDRVSYVLVQNKMRLMLTSPLHSDSPIADHHKKHGDGVKVLALWVDDAYDAFEQTTKRGGKVYMEPVTLKDGDGEVRMSGIHTYGKWCICLLNVKTTTVYLCPALKSGRVLTILSQPVCCMLTIV
jgi:4-hydroxyphenylpyruvate dioxygenase